jgi:hypothetical protein
VKHDREIRTSTTTNYEHELDGVSLNFSPK